MSKSTLVIGDCHGHLDRLEALLLQEGLLLNDPDEGTVRIDKDAEVVQLGDLGHYGVDTKTRDKRIWQYAAPWLDVILWGNHDHAVIDGRHFFQGYARPGNEPDAQPQTEKYIDAEIITGKLRLAHEAHGFLLTHAGLHASFKHNKVPDEFKTDKTALVAWLNEVDQWSSNEPPPYALEHEAIRDNIATSRGGRATAGGILWRDANESHYHDFRQVFGHSSRDEVRKYQTPDGYSYCIDVGNQFNGRLAGMWLPEERVVEVKLDHDQATRDAEDAARKRLAAKWDTTEQRDFWADDGPWRQLVT
jgi:hypothetical protein